MKLVEEAYVDLSGANTTEIGKNQIKLVAEVENKYGNLVDIATFIDAEKAPKKGEELRKDLKVKFDELLNKAKEIDVKEVAEEE